MSATMRLFVIQLRMLVYPLAALVLCVGVYQLAEITQVAQDAIQILSIILCVFVATISGPIVFGFEYQDGAKDYLATKPFSFSQVSNAKDIAIFTFALLGTIAVAGLIDLPLDNALHLVLLLIGWIILLGLTFWCSFITVLAKDPVRGVLYGLITGIPFGLGGIWIWSLAYIPFLMGLPKGETDHWGGFAYAIGCTPPFFLTLIAHALLATAYKKTFVHHRFFPKYLTGVLLLALMYTLVVLAGIRSDASLELSYPERRGANPPILGSTVENGKLRWIDPALGDRKVLHVLSLDFRNPVASPKHERKISIDASPPFTGHQSFFADSERVALTGDCIPRLVSLPIGAEIPITRIVDDGIADASPCYIDGLKIGREEVVLYDANNRTWSLLDMGSATLSPWRQEGIPLNRSGEWVILRSRRYRLEKTREHFSGWRVIVEEKMPGTDSNYESVGNLPLLGQMVVDENRVAGFSLTEEPEDSPGWFVPRFESPIDGEPVKCFLNELLLYDTTDPANPKEIRLSFPRLRARLAISVSKFLGAPEGTIGPPSISLGGGYLIAWFYEVGLGAAWRVEDTLNPTFLGTFVAGPVWAVPIDDYNTTWRARYHQQFWPSLAGPTTPMIRDDGAIGFVSPHYGPFWIKFPELAKEARS